MKKSKKFLAGAVTLMSAFVLGACGAGEGDTTEESSSSGEATEIAFWHAMNGPHQETITKLTNAFNESQDQYVVEEQNQGDYNTLQQKIMASGVSGDLPTMAQLTPGDVPDLAENNLLVPLTDMLVSDSGFTQEAMDDIYEGFLSSSTYNEELYAMPFSKSTRVMYFNQDILDEYGVEVPTTWEEVEALGEQMVAAGDDAVALGLENSYEMEYETMARQNDAEFINGETMTTDIGGEESVEALTFLMDLIDQGYARTAGEDGFFSGPFGRGESALYIGSSAGLAHVAPVAEENGINWSTAELPAYNDTQLTLFAGNDLGVFSSATEEEQQAAVAFMAFLLEPENTATWAIETGYVPIRRSALEVEEYKTYLEENPRAQAANLELEYGMSSPSFVGSGEYRNNLLETLDSVLVNDADIQESLSQLEESTQAILDENK
ncbi:ABC transporter substrate-binding protein [Desemzia sp. RIT804]|uniref:ABC transporter substrate-binding protein n=1 Tax=Desemzia sp. RIT 804 TaxID=2810209 RepID=UPI00194DED8B|nr:ABC transporter substrate-binding protein [Desemzia sp. RIT 804]MBM6615990.1 ABC transporter substrate-binding protein [Desemzia sp. RIT 804]